MKLFALLLIAPGVALAHLTDAERRTLQAAQAIVSEMQEDLGKANTHNIQLQESVVVMKGLTAQTDKALDAVDQQNKEIVRISAENKDRADAAELAKVKAEKGQLWWQVAAVGTWTAIVLVVGLKFYL